MKPADVYLRRAQVIVLLSGLIPTMLTTPIGVVLLVFGDNQNVTLVAGILVLSFCASALAGVVLGWMFLRRSASVVRAQTQFLSSVSHELRTPMTSIRMFVDALLDDRLTDLDARHEALGTMRREVVRLDDLVDRLIELSRIESGRMPFKLEPTAVEPIIELAINAVDTMDLSSTLEVDTQIEPGLEVMADTSALTQAMVNLLANAWKYGRSEQKIQVAARAAGDRWVELEVRDFGAGIPHDEQKHVFEKFGRGRDAERSGKAGSGLGLSIVSAITKAHGGSVELESAGEGKGACFRLSIPRVRPRKGS